jgi:heme o synthase
MTELAATGARPSSRVRDYFQLSKSRIVMMIVMTTVAGYFFGLEGSVDWLILLHTTLGTALVAAGTNAMNQYIERDLDGQMLRTRHRPLPAGRMTERDALLFAGGSAILGIVYLWLAVHWLPALVSFVTLATYLAIYTPLKRVSTFCTVVGAFPGALPPVIGYAAARHELGVPALLLFLLMFYWQLPHFMAIGWLYREDYGRAGFAMLGVIDDDGRRSSVKAILYSVVLLLISLLPTLLGYAGYIYFAAALLSGIALLASALKFSRLRTAISARSLFMMSNLYLPVVMLLLVVDRT